MRKYIVVVMICLPCILSAQSTDQGKQKKPQKTSSIGIKGGLNFANVSSAASINTTNRTGFNAGAFRDMRMRGMMGFRMELDFSRQGYNFKTNTNTGAVDLDYILFANFTTFNFGRVAQIHLGVQLACLLNAKGDSTTSQSSGQYSSMMNYYNRIDYGLAAGVEFYPFKGIIIGSRFNLSLADSFQNPGTTVDQPPSFMPDVNAKNNVVQLYIGYKF